MQSPKSPVPVKIPAPAPPRCTFSYSDGRQCRMLCRPPHPTLCPFHAREELQLLEAEHVAASFAGKSGGFYTFNDVNVALGRLFKAVAANRIAPRSACTLAYIGQLLLQSLPGLEHEVNLVRGRHAWGNFLRKIYVTQPDDADAGAGETGPNDSDDDASAADDAAAAHDGQANDAGDAHENANENETQTDYENVQGNDNGLVH